MKTLIGNKLSFVLSLAASLATSGLAQAQAEKIPFHLTQVYALPPVDLGKVWTTGGGTTHVRDFILPAFNFHDDGQVTLEMIFINQNIQADGTVEEWGTADRYAEGDYAIDLFGTVTLLGEPQSSFTWQGKETATPDADGVSGQLRFVGHDVEGVKIQGTMLFRHVGGGLIGDQSGFYLVPPGK